MTQVNKAGCILINPNTNQVGLIYRSKHDDYSFPKGHQEEGETVMECAIRETIEETLRKVIYDPYSVDGKMYQLVENSIQLKFNQKQKK